MTHTQVWVKIKSYATIAPLSIFSLGRNPINTLKGSIVHLLTLKPLQHTCLDFQCVCDTPQNFPTL